MLEYKYIGLHVVILYINPYERSIFQLMTTAFSEIHV